MTVQEKQEKQKAARRELEEKRLRAAADLEQKREQAKQSLQQKREGFEYKPNQEAMDNVNQWIEETTSDIACQLSKPKKKEDR